MATIADWLKIDGDHVAEALRDACKKLSDADGELVLDFTAMRRIDASAINAMEELATKAREKSVKVVLRGVNVDIYKVLKLSRLTARFAFLT
jgi:anti-anti-sigma regulatory factor